MTQPKFDSYTIWLQPIGDREWKPCATITKASAHGWNPRHAAVFFAGRFQCPWKVLPTGKRPGGQ